ncbi:hypothetical protein L9Z41_16680 [Leptospira noguchii]|uniref:hypothetical protein n=1 Tax=Leptospira noguchii TaxID=28182 RepID=UPI001F05A548|nr:hypothetical protein [Leptospira noguchii]MCH1910493.1 hypothetical protein [Leptospira noguchii]MCH1910687.1 hypothetical protein [Leptospira noguchii]MCH1911019.1 hypothetical protein [Leptospira noguchii]MCH1911780.1 hypothetical protein [Leptospira noguchii]MCH1913067.1 hypothetical protein [Leptospira noguchii]
MSELPLEVREVLENIQDLAATDSNQSENVDQIFYLADEILNKYSTATKTS